MQPESIGTVSSLSTYIQTYMTIYMCMCEEQSASVCEAKGASGQDPHEDCGPSRE